MPRRWIRNLVLAFTLLSAGVVAVQAEESAAARSARMKREFEQKSQQMKKDFEKQKKQNSAAAKSVEPLRTPSAAPPAPQFDPQTAPRPEVCFDAFLRAARSAKSFDEILPYLPADKREYYEREQKRYDPEQARERRLRYEKEGKLDAAAIQHLTQPPYASGLKGYRGMALKVNEFVSAKTQGDRATLNVTIHIDETINGVRYTQSTATIGMIGEGDTWKFESFKEGIEAKR